MGCLISTPELTAVGVHSTSHAADQYNEYYVDEHDRITFACQDTSQTLFLEGHQLASSTYVWRCPNDNDDYHTFDLDCRTVVVATQPPSSPSTQPPTSQPEQPRSDTPPPAPEPLVINVHTRETALVDCPILSTNLTAAGIQAYQSATNLGQHGLSAFPTSDIMLQGQEQSVFLLKPLDTIAFECQLGEQMRFNGEPLAPQPSNVYVYTCDQTEATDFTLPLTCEAALGSSDSV